MESIKNTLMREVVTCSAYFVISILSAIWAGNRFIVVHIFEPMRWHDMEPMGTLRIMQRDYLVPFICAFAILCALRFLSIVLLWHGKRRAIFSDRAQ
jgi:hypothetical protein